MQEPIRFVIENEDHQLVINEEVLKIIEKSENPRFLLFYGSTRQGKSTTLNQIIRGNLETWTYINKSPFKSRTSQNSVTEGCDIFGPIKCSEILKRHESKRNYKEDFDIFFCDTEGLFSLNGQSKYLIPGILTLLQICTVSVIMINTVPDQNTITQIGSEIQISKILQQINPELKSPLVSIYISGYQVDTSEIDDFDLCLSKYEEERDETTDKIFENMKKKYPQLNISKKDFKVIPGGPYQQNFAQEPDHENLDAKLYWHSIHKIFDEFLTYALSTPTHSANKVISLMKVIFEIFKNYKELPDENLDLSQVLVKYIVDLFEKYSKQQFEKINEEIKNDLKNNFEEYFKMLNDDNLAKNKLSTCIEENLYEVYKNLIPDKIKGFMETAMLKLRNSIVNQFELEFKTKCDEIISEEFIYNNIKDIKNEIDKANFQEDIDMNIVNKYPEIWNAIEKENEKLFLYFQSKKPKNIEILKNNFIQSIEKIIQTMISNKIIWKQFFSEKKNLIQSEINKKYSELFNKIQYQEDFYKLIIPNEQLTEELFKKYDEQYFQKLPNEKKQEIYNWIKNQCETTYNKLKENNKLKPKWENINKNTTFIIRDSINNYIQSVFNGKQFKNEIDPNLGREDVIKSKIPKELIQNQEISEEKKQEIINIINEEVKKFVLLFNEKKEQMPLIENFMANNEKKFNKICDDKIKELMSQFYYVEDKIPFNADNFYSLIKYQENYNLNSKENNEKFNQLILNISQNKSYEYNNILVAKLPSWNKKKQDIQLKINEKCNEFVNKIFNNKIYKEEITFDMKKLDDSINSLNLFSQIKENKYKEIENLINQIKLNTSDRIKNEKNGLLKWDDQKEKLISKGFQIMIEKSKENLKTKNENQIVQILINEVKNYPRFFDSCKNEKQIDEIIKILQYKAKPIAIDYIKKINEAEEKERNMKEAREARLRAEKIAREEKEKAEREKQAREKSEREAKERMERERLERIKLEKEAKERAERERLLREKLEKEAKEAKERAERERLAREKFEREVRERAEREARERAEREARERAEREARERAERERQAQYFPRTPYTGVSIVDGLAAIGAVRTYDYRAQIAARNGIQGYVGSPAQNTHMLNLLKNGQLLRP